MIVFDFDIELGAYTSGLVVVNYCFSILCLTYHLSQISDIQSVFTIIQSVLQYSTCLIGFIAAIMLTMTSISLF